MGQLYAYRGIVATVAASATLFPTAEITGDVVLEYASQGRVVATGAVYANRYISVLTIADRTVRRWRDYLDPVAVFDALGGLRMML